jgi:hypothetical protein
MATNQGLDDIHALLAFAHQAFMIRSQNLAPAV